LGPTKLGYGADFKLLLTPLSDAKTQLYVFPSGSNNLFPQYLPGFFFRAKRDGACKQSEHSRRQQQQSERFRESQKVARNHSPTQAT